MVPRQQVIDYISSNTRSGYDIPSIRSRLIASGYEPGEINAAIDYVKSGKTSSSSNHHSGLFVMSIIAVVGFLLIASTALVLFQQNTDLPFTTGGSDTSFNEPIKTTTKSPSTSPSTTNVPSTTSTTTKTTGSSGTATSGSTNFQSSTSVRDSIPSIDYGTGNTQSTLTTRLAIENKVNQLAASKPDEAASLCSQINTVVGQQSCLNTVAQVSEESRFCLQISDVDSADACLTSLALKQAEDINLCKLIKSEIRLRQCALLYNSQSQLETVQKAAAQVQTQTFAPVELTDEQLVEAYTVSLEDAIAQPTVTQPSISTQPEETGEANQPVIEEVVEPQVTQEETAQNQETVEQPVLSNEIILE